MTDRDAVAVDRIVIGMDFSEPARAAAAWAIGQLAPDAEVMLVHALDLEAPASLGEQRPTVSEEVHRTAREFALARLRELAHALDRPGARLELATGRPAPAIAALAERWGAALIVIGPHGGRAPGWRHLGTTAEQLIRVSPVPVLLAARMTDRPVRRLLVPVDEVDLTGTVLEWTHVLARRGDTEVILLHVLDPRWHALPAGRIAPARDDTAISDAPTHEDATTATKAWLADLAGTLPGSVRVDLVVEEGTPGEHVLAAARRSSADLVVMGRRGRGRALPGVLGSTASVVLRGSPCPVLVVVDPVDAIFEDWADDASGGA